MSYKNNKTKQISLFIGAAILGLVLFSEPASATSLIANFGVGETLNLKINGVDSHTWAGSIKIDVDGVKSLALCVDLFSNMNVNQTYGTHLGSEGPILNGRRVAWLMENEMPTLNGAAQFAGLQLAVWDLVHDNGNGFSTGRIQSTSKTDAVALGEANALLALSSGMTAPDGIVYNNYNLCDFSKVQTLMGVPPGGHTGANTPEPQSIGMLVMGGVAGLWMKFRRRK
jgi:hypothetical protein